MSDQSHRNRLVGALAVQLRLVDADALAAAVSHATLAPTQPLEDWLHQQQLLDSQTRDLLRGLVDKQLELSHNSLDDCLSTLYSPPQPSLSTLFQTLPSRDAGGDGDASGERSQSGGVAPDAVSDDPWSTQFKGTGGEVGDSDDDTNKNTQPVGQGHPTRYQKLRDHAKGGLGQVFVARDEELNRQVALKQIQTQFSGNQAARQRFMLEAEITGGLEHPGVVPVYGLGLYEDGQPYYAMRFIRGESMDAAIQDFHKRFPATGAARWRDPTRTMELRKLLSRILDVCQAIAYAHSRGVLHRDIKPENIMLGKYGETLVVDWGLAKVAGAEELEDFVPEEPRLTPTSGSDSAPTRMGSVIGTPGFMSPEQAAGEIDSIRTESDVYSLGASLYYLLVGKPPFASRDADGKPLSIDQLLTRVRNGEYPSPRQTDPSIPKPLAAICVRAMAKEPADRYGSPLELADELERWMADEPVDAYREPAMQRLRRWIKRHQTIAAATAAIVLVSVLGLSSFSVVLGKKNIQLEELAGSLSNKNQELDQRGKELQESNEELQIAEAKATEKAAIATAVTEFLNDDLLSQASPAKHPEPNLQVKTVFQQATESLRERFTDQPLVKAKLLHTIGVASGYLAQWKQSEASLTEALRLRTEHLGPSNAETLQTQAALGRVAASSGKYDEAHAVLTSTLQIQLSELGADHPDVYATQESLAALYSLLGRYEDAQEMNEQSIAGYTKLHGPSAAETLNCLITKVSLLSDEGRITDALDLARKVHADAAATLGPLHFTTYDAQLSVAQQLYLLSRYDEAASVFKSALDELLQTHGESHPYVAIVRNDMALIDSDYGDPVQGLATLRELAQASIEKLGPAHRESIMSQLNVGTALNALGRFEESKPIFESVLQAALDSLGSASPLALQARGLLAGVISELDAPEAAQPLLNELIAAAKTPAQAGSKVVLDAKTMLASLYWQDQKYDEAVELMLAVRAGYARLGLQKTLAVIYPTENLIDALVYSDRIADLDNLLQQLDIDFGPDSAITNGLRLRVAENWIELDQIDRADASIQPVTLWLKARSPLERPDFDVAFYLASLLSMLERREEAIAVYERLVVRQSEVLGVNHVDRLLTLHDLAYEYSELGQHKEAAKLNGEVVRRRTELFGPESEQTLQSLYNLAKAQIALADHKAAIESLTQLVKASEARQDSMVDRMELYLSLAQSQMNTGQYAAAVPNYQASIEGAIESFGEADDNTLWMMHQLAYCLDSSGQPEEAIAMYQRVVAGRSDLLGKSHAYTLMSMGNLAQVQATADRDVDASASLDDLITRVAMLDVGDAVAIDANYAIAEAYRKMDRLDEAITFYDKVADGRKTLLGAEHPQTLLAMHQAAHTSALAQQFDKAVELYAEVVAGRSKTLGPAHEYTLLSLSNAALIQAKRGKVAEAAALYQDLLRRIENAKGSRHADTMAPRTQLALSKYYLKEYAIASELYSFAVDLMRKALPKNPNDASREAFALILAWLADAEVHDGQHLAARRHAQEAIEIWETVAPENWSHYRCISVLGAVEAAAGNHESAQEILQRAYEGLAASKSQIRTIERGEVQIDTVDRLLDSFTQTNNAEQVAKWNQVKESLTAKQEP